MTKSNAELITWIHSQLEIARNRTYPYSDEFIVYKTNILSTCDSESDKDKKENKLVKVQVTNFSSTDNNRHIYICLKPSDSFIYQKIDALNYCPITAVANIASLCDSIIADTELYGIDHCIQRLKDSGYKLDE